MKLHPLVALLLFGAVISPLRAGVVTAGFTGGNGTAAADQYPGVAGSGWAGAWGTGNLPAAGVTAALQSSPQLGTGADSLRVAVVSTGADVGIGRAFLNTNGTLGVDGTKPVTFAFALRVDPATSGFTGSNDYITIQNNAGAVSSSGSSTWIIRLSGGATPQWQTYNGTRDGAAFSAARMVNSGMAFTAGTTYFFTVVADPVARSYSTTISNGNATVTVPGMGFRTSASNVGDTFGIFCKKDAAGDALVFAFDTVRISGETPPQPPDPPATFPVVFDMVQPNPGGGPTQSQFNDPMFTRQAGFNGKVFSLFESSQLAVNWDEFDTPDKIILPAGSADRAWVDAKRAEINAKYDAAKAAGQIGRAHV